MKILLYFCLLAFVLGDAIPEVKASLNFGELNNFKYKVLKPIADQYLHDLAIPADLNVEQKIPILGKLKLEINEIQLNTVDIDWEGVVVRPYQRSDDQIYLQFANVNINLDLYLFAKLRKWKLIDSPTSITIKDLDFMLRMQFQSSGPGTWGFKPVILDNAIDIHSMKIIFHDTKLPKWLVNMMVAMIQPFIAPIAHRIIKNQVTTTLIDMSQKNPITFNLPINDHAKYQIVVSWTRPPLITYLDDEHPFIDLAIDLSILNTVTQKLCPQFDSGNLYQNVDKDLDLEVYIGGNIISQLLWVVIDAGLLDVYANDNLISKAGLPISLTTSGFRLVIADFYNHYQADLPMYLHISASQPSQNVYVRNGRILAQLDVQLEFIVQTQPAGYPVKDVKACLAAGACEIAYASDASLGVMVTAFNLDQETVSLNVLVVKVVKLSPLQDNIVNTIDADALSSTLNSLVGALLPGINGDLAEGIKLPVIGLFGLSSVKVIVADAFIKAGVQFDA